MQRGDSAAALEAKKKELEARRAAASRAEKVYFRVTVRVSGMGVGGVGRWGRALVALAGWKGRPGCHAGAFTPTFFCTIVSLQAPQKAWQGRRRPTDCPVSTLADLFYVGR